MKEYEKPQIKILSEDAEDIVTASVEFPELPIRQGW